MCIQVATPVVLEDRLAHCTIMHISVKDGLKSMRSTMLLRENPKEHGEKLHKIPLNLKMLYATGPNGA